jgi:hypothetical protein
MLEALGSIPSTVKTNTVILGPACQPESALPGIVRPGGVVIDQKNEWMIEMNNA